MAIVQDSLGGADIGLQQISDENWWHSTRPELRLATDPYFVECEPVEAGKYTKLWVQIQANFDKTQKDQQEIPFDPEKQRRTVVFSPVYIGKLPETVGQVLASDADLETVETTLAQHMPEVTSKREISAHRRAKAEGVDLDGVVNIVFFEDDSEVVKKLVAQELDEDSSDAQDRLQVLHRSIMTKVGGFTNILVPCTIDDQNNTHISVLSVGTIEGGHPAFGPHQIDEALEHVTILSSTSRVPLVPEVMPADTAIPRDLHVGSAALEGMIRMAKLAGEHDLFSKPVILQEYLRNRHLGRIIETLIGWSRQAEGTMGYYNPDTYTYVLQATGRIEGVDKTKPTPETAVHVLVDDREDEKSKRLLRIPVEGMGVPLQPTVEAYELIERQAELAKYFPITVEDIASGYIDASAYGNGQPVPPVRAFAHFHRGERTLNWLTHNPAYGPIVEDGIIWIPPSAEDMQHISCGSERMIIRSMDAQLRILQLWEDHDRQPGLGVYGLANHGLMILGLWSENFKDMIPYDPFFSLHKAVKREELQFTRRVHQVKATGYIALEDIK